jgi:hypothetical protein
MVDDILLGEDKTEVKQPFTKASLSMVVADQGGGKSTILTARPVDDVFKHITSVAFNPGTENELIVPASPALKENGKPVIGWATLYFPNKEPMVVELPRNSCARADGIRVFANYHLYGIESVYVDLAFIVEHINDALFMNGWVIIDEGYISADNRNSMTQLNQIIAGALEFQLRKRRIHFLISYPLSRMAELRFKLAKTEYIEPSYNEKTFEVTAKIKRNKKPSQTVTFYAPTYWRFFRTEERFKIPEARVNKALRTVY